MKTITNILMTLVLLYGAISCNKTELQNVETKNITGQHKADWQLPDTDSRNNLLQELQTAKVYFDQHVFTIQYKSAIEEPVFLNSPLKNEPSAVYVYDLRTDAGVPVSKVFYPVVSALDKSGTPMLWAEKKIRFNSGYVPHQFRSGHEIWLASTGVHPIITIEPTGTVYVGNLFNAARQPGALPARQL